MLFYYVLLATCLGQIALWPGILLMASPLLLGIAGAVIVFLLSLLRFDDLDLGERVLGGILIITVAPVLMLTAIPHNVVLDRQSDGFLLKWRFYSTWWLPYAWIISLIGMATEKDITLYPVLNPIDEETFVFENANNAWVRFRVLFNAIYLGMS